MWGFNSPFISTIQNEGISFRLLFAVSFPRCQPCSVYSGSLTLLVLPLHSPANMPPHEGKGGSYCNVAAKWLVYSSNQLKKYKQKALN